MIKPINSKSEIIKSTENNPNIDDMISSLNLKLESISNPSKHRHRQHNDCNHLHHKHNHNQNNNELSLHCQQNIDLSLHKFISNTQSTSSNNKHDRNQSLHSRLHEDDTFEIGQLTDSESDYETDTSSIMTSSPNHHDIYNKIKAMPVLSQAWDNEIFQFTLSENKSNDNDSYYDTAEFDDESEYDTDDVNNYDNIS